MRSTGSSNSGLDGLLLGTLLLDAGSTWPSNNGLNGLLLDTLDAILLALDELLLDALERSSPTSELGSRDPLPSQGGKHGPPLVLLRRAF